MNLVTVESFLSKRPDEYDVEYLKSVFGDGISLIDFVKLTLSKTTKINSTDCICYIIDSKSDLPNNTLNIFYKNIITRIINMILERYYIDEWKTWAIKWIDDPTNNNNDLKPIENIVFNEFNKEKRLSAKSCILWAALNLTRIINFMNNDEFNCGNHINLLQCIQSSLYYDGLSNGMLFDDVENTDSIIKIMTDECIIECQELLKILEETNQ